MPTTPTTPTQKTFTDSTNVKQIRYSEESRIMQVTFTSGSTYQYFDVPPRTWEAALLASSIGGFISTNIKGKFKYSKV